MSGDIDNNINPLCIVYKPDFVSGGLTFSSCSSESSAHFSVPCVATTDPFSGTVGSDRCDPGWLPVAPGVELSWLCTGLSGEWATWR